MKLEKFLIPVTLVGLILRIIPVLLTHSLGISLDDMFQYDMLARSIVNGNGYRWYAYEDLRMLEPYVHFNLSSPGYDPVRGVPTSFRAPLYPAFLALIYLFAGTGPGRFFAVRLVQAGLGALLPFLTGFLCMRLFPDRKSPAVIAAWVVACYPLLIVYPIGLASENIFFILVLASLFLLIRTIDDPTVFNFILSGLFLALGALTRSVFLSAGALAVLWTWYILKEKRGAIMMALVILVTLSPWVVRNSMLHHKLSGLESSLGYNLYVGYHPDSDGSFTFGPSLSLLSILDDAERDRVGFQQAMVFIRSRPMRFFQLLLNRLGFFFGLEKRALMYFYSNNMFGYISAPFLITLLGIALLPFVIIAPSAVLGFALSRLNPKTFLLYAVLIAYILPHILILSEDRFHLALIPFFAIFAARSWTARLDDFVDRWRESRSGKIIIVLVVVWISFLFINWGNELYRDADKIASLLGPEGNKTYYPY